MGKKNKHHNPDEYTNDPKTWPAVREFADNIQIDAKKGGWPFTHFIRGDDGGLLVVIDKNEQGHIVSEGVGLADIYLSPKKAKALTKFLVRTSK